MRIYELAGGDVTVWVDSGSFMLKLHNKFGDPTELGEQDALELGELLIRLAKEEMK